MLRSNDPPRISKAPEVNTRIQSVQSGRDWKANRPKVAVTPDPSAPLGLHGEDHDPNLAETTSKRLGGPPRVAVTKPPPKPRQPLPKKRQKAPIRPKGLQGFRYDEWTRRPGYGDEHMKDSRGFPRYREDESRWDYEERERDYHQGAWNHYRDRVTPQQESNRSGSSSRYSFDSHSRFYDAEEANSMANQAFRSTPGLMHPHPSFSPSTDSPSTPEDLPTDVKIGNSVNNGYLPSPMELTTLPGGIKTSVPNEGTLQYHSTASPSQDDLSPNSFKVEEGPSSLQLALEHARSALGLMREKESRRSGSLTPPLKRKFTKSPSPSQSDIFKRRQMSEANIAIGAGTSETLPSKTLDQELIESNHASPMLIDGETPIVVKREPSPDRLPSPIDVDAPPLTLYEQLGLPERRSGSHRVSRPNYSILQSIERKAWAEEMSNAIRWVRGNGFPPLIMGSVFWRADGVCFDWSVSEDELLGAADREASTSTEHAQEGPNATPKYQQEQRPDHIEDANSNQGMTGAVDPPRVGFPSLSADTLSGIAICFLDRYTRCFDHVANRKELLKAYSADAVMTLQFNDLPSEGRCPRVGNPRRQGHLIVDLTEREYGRNLLLSSDRDPTHSSYHYRARKCFNSGPQAIISKLVEFDDLTHSPTPVSPSSFQFDIVAFADLGCLLLKFYGELYHRHTVERPSSVALRFDRSFLLRQNDVNSPSWIDWPWIIINDQMTLFHRQGIICQCSH